MADKYLGTTERAALIRAELKKKKWSSRDVSVKADHFSMGSAIRIRIKNPAVPLAEVKAIAAEHENVSRDASGEILSGATAISTSASAKRPAKRWPPSISKQYRRPLRSWPPPSRPATSSRSRAPAASSSALATMGWPMASLSGRRAPATKPRSAT